MACVTCVADVADVTDMACLSIKIKILPSFFNYNFNKFDSRIDSVKSSIYNSCVLAC